MTIKDEDLPELPWPDAYAMSAKGHDVHYHTEEQVRQIQREAREQGRKHGFSQGYEMGYEGGKEFERNRKVELSKEDLWEEIGNNTLPSDSFFVVMKVAIAAYEAKRLT